MYIEHIPDSYKKGGVIIKEFLVFSFKAIKGNYFKLILLTLTCAITSIISLMLPLLSGKFIDDLITNPKLDIVLYYCSIIIFFNAINLLLSYFIMIININIQIESSFQLNMNILNKLQRVSIHYLQANDVSYLNQRINNDSNAIVIFIINLVKDIVINIITLVYSITVLIRINTLIAALFIAIVIFYLILFKAIKNKLVILKRELLERQGEYFSKLQDQLGYIRFIKFYNQSKLFREDINIKFKELKKYTLKCQKYMYFVSSGETATLTLTEVCLYIIGGFQIISGKLTIGMFTILSNYFNNIVSVIKYFANLYQEFLSTLVSFNRIEELHDLSDDNYGEIILNKVNKINLEAVSYSYKDQNKKVLSDFSFTFEMGNLYLIKGKNGIGKSTLVNIITGLYTDYSGNIFYNELNIKEIDLYNTRENCFGLVDQKPLLFKGTIMDNLSLTQNINSKELNELMKIFHLDNKCDENDNFVRKNIHELNSNVSGGEGQKINLIREFLRNKDVMIFDEPTAFLDSESKKNFISYLMKLKSNHIIIMISHDNDIMEYADKVLQL